jgi:hypothetical protein
LRGDEHPDKDVDDRLPSPHKSSELLPVVLLWLMLLLPEVSFVLRIDCHTLNVLLVARAVVASGQLLCIGNWKFDVTSIAIMVNINLVIVSLMMRVHYQESLELDACPLKKVWIDAVEVQLRDWLKVVVACAFVDQRVLLVGGLRANFQLVPKCVAPIISFPSPFRYRAPNTNRGPGSGMQYST